MKWFRRRPVYGPPLPAIECGESDWRGRKCDLPFGHSGNHGRIIATSVSTGGLIERRSVTRETWSA